MNLPIHSLPKPVLDSVITLPEGCHYFPPTSSVWASQKGSLQAEAAMGDTMAGRPVLYQKLQLWESSLESEDEEEISESLAPDPWRPQNYPG